MDCLVRSARREDGEALVGLLDQLGYTVSASDVERRLRLVAERPDDLVRVAVQGGAVVGLLSMHVLLYFHEGITLGRVSALIVHEAHREQGIGRRLMEDAEQRARAHGCSKMEVASALWRTGAHAFYEKIGYECIAYRFLKSLAPGSGGG